MIDSSRPHELQPTRLLCPWDFPGQSTGVGCHCLLWKLVTVEYNPPKGFRADSSEEVLFYLRLEE